MDVYGNRELIYEGSNQIFHAIPLRPRPRRAGCRRTDGAARPHGAVPSTGGRDLQRERVPRCAGRTPRHGAVSAHPQYRPQDVHLLAQTPVHLNRPVVSAVQSEGVKRILGTVPVEADGSVSLLPPPAWRCISSCSTNGIGPADHARSFVNIMPGESRGCLGCHELHSKAPGFEPRPALNARPARSRHRRRGRPIQRVTPVTCVRCSTGIARPAMKATAKAARCSFDRAPQHARFHRALPDPDRPAFVGRAVRRQNPPPAGHFASQLMVEAYSTTDPEAYKTPKPMTALSYKGASSDRIQRRPSRGGGRFRRLQRLIARVDAMCPTGEEEVRAIPDPDFQGIDWLACARASPPRRRLSAGSID